MLSKEQRDHVKAVAGLVMLRYRIGRRHRFDKRDFFRICQRERIKILDTPEAMCITKWTGIRGYLIATTDGSRAIYLRSLFEDQLDITTAAHELGHFFLGHQGAGPLAKRNGLTRDEKEAEADLFSEILCSWR